jgi:hypothetical protein
MAFGEFVSTLLAAQAKPATAPSPQSLPSLRPLSHRRESSSESCDPPPCHRRRHWGEAGRPPARCAGLGSGGAMYGQSHQTTGSAKNCRADLSPVIRVACHLVLSARKRDSAAYMPLEAHTCQSQVSYSTPSPQTLAASAPMKPLPERTCPCLSTTILVGIWAVTGMPDSSPSACLGP